MADIIARPEDHLHKFKTYGDEDDGSTGVIPYVEADVTVTSGSVVVTSGEITVDGTVAISSGSIVVTNIVLADVTGQGDVPITLDSEVVEVDATGQGDIPITLDSEVVEVDATGQGDVPITLDSEVVAVDATGQGDIPVTISSGSVVVTSGGITVDGTVAVSSGSIVVTNVVEVDATGQGDVPITLDSEVVEVDATGQGDIPITLDGEAVVLGAGEAHVGQVGGEGITISQTPTVTAGAYAAGDAVGGLLTFANAGRASTLGGVIKDLLILDDAGQDVELELWLFNATFTAMADNAAWAPSEADLRKLVGIISTADGAWFAAGTPSVARVEASQRYDLVGTSLFGQLVTRGTPTFAATDDVTVKIGLLQD